MTGKSIGLLLALALLAGCGASYRPGVSGQYRTLDQNASANSEPQPPGSMPR